jgi:Flp pilus assembly protein TadG
VPSKTEKTAKRTSQKGAVQVEFALVALSLFFLFFGIVEMERMLLVYTALSNSARAGVRYAMVHGSDRTGTGATGPSSSSAHTSVQDAVKTMASTGTINTANLTVNVNYTACPACTNSNDPGSTVSVQVIYPYDPLTALPLTVNLSSISEGIITF